MIIELNKFNIFMFSLTMSGSGCATKLMQFSVIAWLYIPAHIF